MVQRPFTDPVEAILAPYGQFESMLELGNKKTHNVAWKPYFEALGIRHVSVDLNGLDGALNLDLQEPLGLGRFDMVTNFGTTEHVEHQEPVWRNIHEACEQVFVSSTPKPGHWAEHGRYYPTNEFYLRFAELNGFRVDLLNTRNQQAARRRELINVRMTREKWVEFQMPDPDLIYINDTGRFVGVAN